MFELKSYVSYGTNMETRHGILSLIRTHMETKYCDLCAFAINRYAFIFQRI